MPSHHLLRSPISATLAVIAAAGALLAPALVSAPAAHATASKPDAVISIGDSIASGEGGRLAGDAYGQGDQMTTNMQAYADMSGGNPENIYGASWYYTDSSGTHDNGCHRSTVSPIHGITGVVDLNIACSGATTWDVMRGGGSLKGEAPQADQLAALAQQYNIKAVVLSIGANDMGFGGFVTDCFTRFTFGLAACYGADDTPFRKLLGTVQGYVENAINDIRSAMSGAGYAPGAYKLIVEDYPAVVPTSANLTSDRSDRGCPMYSTDADWVNNRVIPRLQGMVRKAAYDTGAQFLDISQALQGHELCNVFAQPVNGAPVDMTYAEWANRLNDSSNDGYKNESIHPNYYGQKALQRCLDLMYNASGDQQCVNMPGYSNADGIRLTPWHDPTPNQPNTLVAGETLGTNQCKSSYNNKARLCMQNDGNLVVYDENWQPRWQAWTAGTGTSNSAYMGGDGNFIEFGPSGNDVWDTGTWANPGAYLLCQEDGNVVIYNSAGYALWWTGTTH